MRRHLFPQGALGVSGQEVAMVVISELVFLAVVILLGVLWYLRTPIHRARKRSGLPPTHHPIGGHRGPPPPPQALREHRVHDEDS